MINKCLIVLAIAVTVQGGLVRNNIPVEVVYDDKPGATFKERVYAERNLDEKVQLSPSDLKEASKHIPVVEEVAPVVKNVAVPENEFETLGETEKEQYSTVIAKLQHYILGTVKGWRQNLADEKNQPTPEQWDEYERKVEEIFVAEKNKINLLKQTQNQNQNQFQIWMENTLNQVSNVTQSFGNIFTQNNNNNNGTQSDAPAQNNFITQITNGIQGIQSNIQSIMNIGQNGQNNSTNLSDAPANNGNMFTNFINQIQNVFNSNNNPNGTQGDEAGQQNFPQQIITTIQGSVGNFFNQINPQRPPSTSGDEAGAPPANNNVFQQIQNIPSQISTTFTNWIGGTNNQQQTGGSGTPSNGSNPLQQFGNQINQAVANNPIQTAISGASGSKKPEPVKDEVPAKEPVKVEEPPKENEAVKSLIVEDAPKKEEIMEPMKEEIKEPMKAELIKEVPMTEPLKSEPINEKVMVEPMKSEPINEKVMVEPMKSEPINEKVMVEPMKSEPINEKVMVEPMKSEPIKKEPLTEAKEQTDKKEMMMTME